MIRRVLSFPETTSFVGAPGDTFMLLILTFSVRPGILLSAFMIRCGPFLTEILPEASALKRPTWRPMAASMISRPPIFERTMDVTGPDHTSPAPVRLKTSCSYVVWTGRARRQFISASACCGKVERKHLLVASSASVYARVEGKENPCFRAAWL